jgi:peptidyl-prolyl cis-trans isomerase C
MQLMAQGAHDAGLDKGPEFDRRVEFLRLQALRNVFVEHEVVKNVADSELQQAYQTLVVAQHKPEQQVHARHILVETKEQADKIIEQLKGGASFEELAKQSKDPSGQNGGDLGFFGPGQMVPPFEKAAFALAPGEFTQEPVQSEFGWHVIKVEEKRMSQPPTFDEVKDQLKNYVLRQKFEQVTAALREKYPVEIIDPTAMPPAPPAPPAPATGEPAPAPAPAPAP